MTFDALMNALHSAGVRVWREGESLRVDAPAGALTGDLRDAMRRHKAGLLALHADPRPDLEDDHHLWVALLAEARRIDPAPGTERSLHGLLHGLRCGGCRLRWTDAGRLRLDYSELLETWEEAELREGWLIPQAAGITSAVRAVEEITERSEAA